MAAAVSGIQELNKCSYDITSPDANPASHYANDMSQPCKLVQGGGVCIVVAVLLSVYALIPEKQRRGSISSTGFSDKLSGDGRAEGEYDPPIIDSPMLTEEGSGNSK